VIELTKNERVAVIFLLVILTAGLGVVAYQKTRPCARVETDNFETGRTEDVISVKGKIDINVATAQDLERLEGIGKSLAGRIIAYRDSQGRLASTEELKNVKGIGDKLFDKIKDRISAE